MGDRSLLYTAAESAHLLASKLYLQLHGIFTRLYRVNKKDVINTGRQILPCFDDKLDKIIFEKHKF